MNTSYVIPNGMPEPPVRMTMGAETFAGASAYAPIAMSAAGMPEALANAVPAANPAEQRADSFSKTSSAFVVLGLALVGGAIVPLLEYFHIAGMVAYFISVGYIVLACLTVAWLAGRLFAHSAQSYRYARMTRIGVLVAGELSVCFLAGPAHLADYGAGILATTLAVVPLGLQLALNEKARWNSYTVLRVNELLVMALSAPVLLFGNFTFDGQDTPALALCIPAVLLGAVVVLHVLELGKADAHPGARNGLVLVATALGFTLLLACCLFQFTHAAYAFDALFMLAALVCTALGFGQDVPALRRTGLVLALATVAKMVTLDTWGFDPLGKAVAYLLGGAVCFALGAMYNYAVKRMEVRKES